MKDRVSDPDIFGLLDLDPYLITGPDTDQECKKIVCYQKVSVPRKKKRNIKYGNSKHLYAFLCQIGLL